MDINSLVESHANVIIAVSTEDLKKYSIDLLNGFMEQFKQAPEEKFFTIEDVCKRLAVDKSTLYRWAKLGYLPNVKMGGKVRYRESDIKKIMEG